MTAFCAVLFTIGLLFLLSAADAGGLFTLIHAGIGLALLALAAGLYHDGRKG